MAFHTFQDAVDGAAVTYPDLANNATLALSYVKRVWRRVMQVAQIEAQEETVSTLTNGTRGYVIDTTVQPIDKIRTVYYVTSPTVATQLRPVSTDWMDRHGNRDWRLQGVTVDSGTTDGATTTNKLIQSGQNFVTTVNVGDIVQNTTDSTTAAVTAVDSNTQLTLDADVMATGEVYVIVRAVTGTPKRYYIEALDDQTVVIGLDPVPNTTVSSGFPKVVLYGSSYIVPSLGNDVPGIVDDIGLLISGVKSLHAEDKDPARFVLWDELYEGYLRRFIDHVNAQQEDSDTPKMEVAWITNTIIE